MNRLITLPSVNEGDLWTVLMMVDLVKENYTNKIPDMIKRYSALIGNTRHSLKKRLYAIHLCCNVLYRTYLLEVFNSAKD